MSLQDCGSEYEGQFVDGEMTGEGIKRWHDGSNFEGQFEEGEARVTAGVPFP